MTAKTTTTRLRLRIRGEAAARAAVWILAVALACWAPSGARASRAMLLQQPLQRRQQQQLEEKDPFEAGRDGRIGGGGLVAMEYPVSRSIPFNKHWRILRQEFAPEIRPHEGFLRFNTTSLNPEGIDAWVFVTLQPPLPSNGSFTRFRIRANPPYQGIETKLTILGSLVLRFTDDGSKVTWDKWDAEEGIFQTLGISGIKTDGDWHEVMALVTPTGIYLVEDGQLLFIWDRADMPTIMEQTFHVCVHDPGSEMSLDVGDVQSIMNEA